MQVLKAMIVFTEHALLKLEQRGIDKEWVIKAIQKPDHRNASYGDRIRMFKKLGKNYLEVIIREESNDIVVITQHWIKKLPRNL